MYSNMNFFILRKIFLGLWKQRALSSLIDWYNGNQSVPVLHAWIHRFSIYAVIIRPKKTTFSVPSSGQIWRPFEDGRIALDFPPGCFGEAANTSCNAKVKFCVHSIQLILISLTSLIESASSSYSILLEYPPLSRAPN